MLNETMVVIVSDHGGWNRSHSFVKPFSALVDIPILIRGECKLIKLQSLICSKLFFLEVY